MVPNAQSSSDRPLAYQNVETVQVLCMLHEDGRVANKAQRAEFCGGVAAAAKSKLGIPVSVIELGDPKVVASRSLTILVHAAISGESDQRELALVMRPYRVSDGSDVLFGSVPRVAPVRDRDRIGAAIAESLEEILP